MSTRRPTLIGFTFALTLLTAACSGTSASSADSSDPSAAASETSAQATVSDPTEASSTAGTGGGDSTAPSAGSFPVTVTNCSNEITFEGPPQRVVLLRNEVVPVLSSLGVLDRVVGLVGRFHDSYFDEPTREQLAGIPVLSDRISQVGGGEISIEDVLAEEPDLVIGTSETVTREGLLAQGVQVLENEESCEGSRATSTLDDLDTLFELYGDVFDRSAEADAALADLDAQIEETVSRIEPGESRTAAMLYPTLGGGSPYAYGSGSMNHTLLELAGFTNVFADVPDRTYEVSVEELIAQDPDVLILLHSGADPAELEEAVTSLPGAEGLTAVQNGDLMPLLFGFASPASPIVIQGLDDIVQYFGE